MPGQAPPEVTISFFNDTTGKRKKLVASGAKTGMLKKGRRLKRRGATHVKYAGIS